MTPMDERFPPTEAAARARLAAVKPAAYARSRNALDGAVTRLSPYLTHGLLTLPEVLADLATRHRLDVQHKLVYEFGWREYFRHVWQQQGEGILASLHPGPLPDAAYAPELPAALREARTGVPAIDAAVRTLYATGWLHNHARMWLASFCVHHLKLHWRAGADWLYGHLLDGDLASNHLSWQWVAGTGSHKPYLFNADNVARYAPPDWHSPGSAIDRSYEALDAIARRPGALALPPALAGVEEQALSSAPPAACGGVAPDPAAVAGRDVWLVHPWALRPPPQDLPPDTQVLGLWPAGLHRRFPWSARRWAFVGERLAALAGPCWWGEDEALAEALRGARSVSGIADPHLPAALDAVVRWRPAPALFAPVERRCSSFSQWWTRTTRGRDEVWQLPGLASGLATPPGGPPLHDTLPLFDPKDPR